MQKVTEKSKHGQTPLHVASEWRLGDIVTLQMAAGADPNKADNGGARPMHMAAKHNYIDVVRLLGHGGAEVNSEDDLAQTAI